MDLFFHIGYCSGAHAHIGPVHKHISPAHEFGHEALVRVLG